MMTDDQKQTVKLIYKRLAFTASHPTAKTHSQPAEGASRSGPSVAERRRRLSKLSPRELEERLRPVAKYYAREAWPEDWSLYWLQSSLRGAASNAHEIRLLELLIARYKKQGDLQSYTFFQQAAIYPHLIEWFTLNSPGLQPAPAIGVRPEAGPARFPSYADVQAIDKDDAVALSSQKKQDMRLEDFFPYMPPPVYWLRGDQDLALQKMFGYGGWSVSLTSLEEKKFFAASKKLLTENAGGGVKAIPIVTPLVTQSFFIGGSSGLLQQWFETFDLFVAECPEAGGILIAAKSCLDDLLPELVLESGLREREQLGPKLVYRT